MYFVMPPQNEINYKDEMLTSQLILMLQINNSIQLTLFPTVLSVRCQTHLISSNPWETSYYPTLHFASLC